jgi:hypothetical protein
MSGQDGGRISCNTEKGGVTEGQKAGVAHKKIQTHDKESEYKDLRKQTDKSQIYENGQCDKEQYDDKRRGQAK